MAETFDAALPEPARGEDLAACRALLRTGSRSFYFASHLLPRTAAERASALYAFCRQVDDVVDDEARAPEALPRLRERLAAVYRGAALDSPVDRAFAAVVAEQRVPEALPRALIEGMEWDAEDRRYETLSDVLAYSARVAASVGAMMSVVMERRAPGTLARACDLGVAMQLSNIARDVGEDARMGRVYLPREWLAEAGIDAEAWLARPEFTPALGEVVKRLLDAAWPLYERAAVGIAELPAGCRPGIHMAARVYAEIGREVLRRGGDSVSSRAVVGGGRKVALLPGACLAALRRPPVDRSPALEETRFLVDAVAAADAES
ncbi:MAG: phytoene/squalene synthase family protein [Pseudomonadales bacterium]|nr:phytoene/squalene synthase family protein [Pseudomonadales bacterium]